MFIFICKIKFFEGDWKIKGKKKVSNSSKNISLIFNSEKLVCILGKQILC